MDGISGGAQRALKSTHCECTPGDFQDGDMSLVAQFVWSFARQVTLVHTPLHVTGPIHIYMHARF